MRVDATRAGVGFKRSETSAETVASHRQLDRNSTSQIAGARRKSRLTDEGKALIISHLDNGDSLAEQSSNKADEILTWHFSDRPKITMRRRVMEGIDAEVMAATNAGSLPRLEVGGILLGHSDKDRILIEDFEPVLCDHCFGPSYLLVGDDRVAMEETLNWFRNGSPLSILGWYRSITRPDFSFENEAIDLLLPTPLEGGDIALLLFPHRPQPARIQFLFKGQGELLEAPFQAGPRPDGALADDGGPELVSETVLLNDQQQTPEITLAPAERPGQVLMQRASSHNRRKGWLWVASAVVFGAVLAYVSAREPKRSSPLPAPLAAVSQPRREDSADRVQQANGGQESTDAQIRKFLENWAEAARAGDLERAANMYAEQVSTYFTKRNVTRAVVRRERNLNLARYGRMSVYRIGDIQISPITNNQASVTFRKMWQSSGPRVTSGEEKEQLILKRDAAIWRIVSEKEITVYWVKKPR